MRDKILVAAVACSGGRCQTFFSSRNPDNGLKPAPGKFMVPGLVTIKTRTKPATKAGKRPGQLVRWGLFLKGLVCCHSPHGACNMKPVAALMRGLSFQAHVRQGGDGQGAASQDCGEGVRGQGCQRSVLMRRWHLEEPVMPQGCAL